MILIDPAFYWEFRARSVEREMAVQQMQQSARALEAIRRTIETRYPGVDLTKSYRWNDAQCALVPVGQDVAPVANE